MRSKKFGGLKCVRDCTMSKAIFWNQEKSLELYRVTEWLSGKAFVHFEVRKLTLVEIPNNTFGLKSFRFDKALVLSTENYASAWNLVCTRSDRFIRTR